MSSIIKILFCAFSVVAVISARSPMDGQPPMDSPAATRELLVSHGQM